MNLDAFLEIENRYGLLEERYDGFAYWIYFRHVLHNELEASKAGHGGNPERVHLSRWQHFKERLGTLWYAARFHKISSMKQKILILNHERRAWMGDHYECVYTDLIADEYENSLVVERPYQQKHFRPVKTKNLIYTDYIEAKAMLHYYCKRIFASDQMEKVKTAIGLKIQKPIEEICRRYGLTYRADSILDKMVCGYYIYQIKRREFRKLLQKSAPKVILEVVGYHMDCMIINELALEYGIPTIELQHGTAGREHTAYNYPEGCKIDQFPQYFFAFSRFWMDAARFPISRDRIRETGFPHLEKYALPVKKSVKRVKPAIIIFISQSVIGNILADIAIKLNKKIDREQYEIIYKLHPGEYEGWKERYRELAESDIKVIDNNRMDLYELFAMATYQIGAFGSTATFEGLLFDLKTYIRREEAAPELCLLCEKGIARFFDQAEDLYQLILADEEVNMINGFWKDNALETMKQEICAIMERTGKRPDEYF